MALVSGNRSGVGGVIIRIPPGRKRTSNQSCSNCQKLLILFDKHMPPHTDLGFKVQRVANLNFGFSWFGGQPFLKIKPPSVIQFTWQGFGLGRIVLVGGRGWRDAKR